MHIYGMCMGAYNYKGRASFMGLFKTLAVMGFICMLLVEGREARASSTTSTTPIGTSSSRGRRVIASPGVRADVDYMSERRVPKGPDPTHNRESCRSEGRN